MATDPIISAVFHLTPAEKLRLVEDLWDDLTAAPNAVPWHDWQKEELARRRENFERDPGSAASWEDAKRMIRGQ